MYLTVKILSFLLTKLPVSAVLFFARMLGFLLYISSIKKRRIAYINLKRAFGDKLDQKQLKKILKGSFINFTQNIAEVLYLPKIDKSYIEKYVKIRGLNYIDDALKEGKGVIIAGTHFGSWEVSSSACSLLGYDYNLIFKQQKHEELNDLLNEYRTRAGAKIVPRGFSIRDIIKALKKNALVGLAMDQGAVEGNMMVDFFGDRAPFPTGTLRIALKTKSKVIPAYVRRVKGPYHELVFLPPLNLHGITEEKLDVPLKKYAETCERFISEYPEDYFWFYKRWKRTDARKCLILSDSKAGHLSQIKGLMRLLRKSNFQIKEKVVEIKYKNELAKNFLSCCALSSSPLCKGCLSCLRMCLTKESYDELRAQYADLIVSCGSSTAAVNLIYKNETGARSIALMKPSVLFLSRLDLIISPKHDRLGNRKNVIETDLALNPIDVEYLKKNKQELLGEFPELAGLKGKTLSFLLGGDNRSQKMESSAIEKLIRDLKDLSLRLGLNLLVTTSRRTPNEVEGLLKKELKDFANCKLLIIANEYNPKATAAGMFAVADLILTSSDSISMVSEALCTDKPVAVFRLKGLENTKHERFLNNLAAKNYLRLFDLEDQFSTIEKLIIKSDLNRVSEYMSDLENKILEKAL